MDSSRPISVFLLVSCSFERGEILGDVYIIEWDRTNEYEMLLFTINQ